MQLMEGIFYDKIEDYDNKLDPLRDYCKQITNMVINETGITEEEAFLVAKEIVKENINNPELRFFMRQGNGDRALNTTTLLGYIATHNKQQNIIAPTFTTYVPPSVKKSLLSDYIEINVVKRAAAKKAGQKAEAEGRMEEAEGLSNQQKNFKTNNNGLSGLFAMVSSVVYNLTNHSTLTTLTRSITSLSNANNERLIEGNRALFTPADVLRSVVNESTFCNQENIAYAMREHNLHYPSVEEVVSVLKYSSDNYTRDYHFYDVYIIPYLRNLNKEQLAAIAYTLDFKHTLEFNPEFFKKFLDDFTYKASGYEETPMEDVSLMKKVPEPILFFAHNIFSGTIKGMGKDYGVMNKNGVANNLYHTCMNIQKMLLKYKAFFNAFIKVNISPINSFKLKEMRRRAVVLSDTDSSAFSTDFYIKWKLGKFEYSERSTAITGAITYFASESIIHQLTMLSKTMNIPLDQLRRLAMKNEFLWSCHIPTDASKHYFANTCIEEGNVYPKPKLEVKGVHLRNSAVPHESTDEGVKLMNSILDAVREGEDLKLDDVIKDVIRVENLIIDSIRSGETTFLKIGRINDADSYAKGVDESPFGRHIFWKEVFEDKYGVVGEPPYATVKLPLTLNNKTKINDFLENIKDEKVKANFKTWVTRLNKTSLNNLYINNEWIDSNGFPTELMDYLDVEATVLDMTKQLRLILESLGLLIHEGVMVKEQFLL